MKIVFLDIDGVLNSSLTHGRLDKQYYELLQQLVEYTDCYFVISSSWRCMNVEDTRYELSGHIKENNKKNKNRASKLQDPFPDWLIDRIVDITPRAYYFINYNIQKHFLCPRGIEIDKFLKDTDIDVENYVILDDDDDMLLSQINHLVVTDDEAGLTETDVQKCIKILNSDE